MNDQSRNVTHSFIAEPVVLFPMNPSHEPQTHRNVFTPLEQSKLLRDPFNQLPQQTKSPSPNPATRAT